MKCSLVSKAASHIKKLIYSEGVNPLPGKVIMCVFLLMLLNSVTMTMVFSFLPKLVKSFGISEVDTGSKVGLIASALYVGRTIFSLVWGYFADSKGRKKMAILSGTLLSFTTLAFGFSSNIPWAVVSRFFHGCFMGVVVITKSIVSDVCDETNSALGMSILLSALSTGLIIGPAIGGFLSFPDDLYPNTFSSDSLFGVFSVLLPSLLISIAFGLTTILSIICLPSDEKIVRGTSEEKVSLLSDELDWRRNYIYERSQSNTHYLYYSMSLPDTLENVTYSDFNVKKIFLSAKNISIKKCCQIPSLSEIKDSKVYKVLRSRECVLASFMYGMYSLVAIGFDELFPLYAATSRHYHGYGFSTSEISTALLVAAFLLLIMQITLLPKIVDIWGAKKLYIYAGFLQALVFPTIPSLQFIEDRNLFWVLLIFALLIIRGSLAASLLAVNIILNESVAPELVGSANGFGLTFANVSRIVAPSLVGNLFSWSLQNVKQVLGNTNPRGFPLNHFFTFFVLSTLSTINSIWVIYAFYETSNLDRRTSTIANDALEDENGTVDSELSGKVTICSFKSESTIDGMYY